jgi:hypothetical protein
VAGEENVRAVAQSLDAEVVEKGQTADLVEKVRRLLDEAAPGR